MIFLHKPYIKEEKNKSRLCFDIEIDEVKKNVFFEVEKEYEQYLCSDRIDAILVGILPYAMRNNHNIKSDSYITEEILFKINNYLIPSLTKYDSNLHNINIKIKTKEACKNRGKVGTGISCGVDSLHAYYSHYNEENEQYKLTHLCINNVGAFNNTYKEQGIEKVRKERYKKSNEFAKEVNLPIIITNSNIDDEIEQVHSFTHTYTSSFAVLCMQKLWRTYYYGSSGYDLSKFNIKATSEKDCSSYDILALDCFSTNNLKIYSEGAAKDRLEKTKYIVDKKLTKKYLHVCLKKEFNCSVCDKCRRTLLTIDALNINLQDYKDIFDIDYYEKNKEEYYEWIQKEHMWSNSSINEPTYQLLLKKKDFYEYVKKYEKTKEENTLDYKMEYEKVINSKTFKVGDKIMFIPRSIKRIISSGVKDDKKQKNSN